MDEATESHTDKDIATKMYLAILVSFVLTLVPTMSMAIVSTVLLTVLLIAAYVIRGRVAEGGLAHHHMHYIIRTAWIGGFYTLILVGLSSVYMIATIDYSPIEPCAQSMANAGMGGSEAEILQMVQPCIDHFIIVNTSTLMMTALITAAPLLLFFFYRFGMAYFRARKSEMMAKPKSWL